MNRTKTLKSFFFRKFIDKKCQRIQGKTGGQRAKHSHSHYNQREISGDKILFLMKYERRRQTKPSLVRFFLPLSCFHQVCCGFKHGIEISSKLMHL